MKKPTHIYKYLTPEAALAVLGSQKIRFSKYTTFNDCFECWLTICPPNEKELAEFINEIPNSMSQLKGLYIEYIEDLKKTEKMWNEKANYFRKKGDENTAISFEKLIDIQLKSRFKLYGFNKKSLTDKIFLDFFNKNKISFYSELLNIISIYAFKASHCVQDGIKNEVPPIACFSENKSHHLMVGHYTNGGRGLIIEFDFNKLLLNFKDYKKIEYSKKPSEYRFLDIIKRGEITSKFLEENVIYKKQIDWEYEKEWRIMQNLYTKKLNFLDTLFPQDSIKTILLGPNASIEFSRTVFLLTKQFYPEAKIKLLTRSLDKYDFVETAEAHDLKHLEGMITGDFSK